MNYCKKTFLSFALALTIPLTLWAEAPVIDESGNFAMMDEEQAPVADNRYDEPQIENGDLDAPRNRKYSKQNDGGPALARDDQGSASMSTNASMIGKVLTLQKEVQELRGQLEVQSHELQLLKQQQLAFYKDLDSRVGSPTAPGKAPAELSIGDKSASPVPVTQPTSSVSKANPADEQIGYLAAYELVKNKQYDHAVEAMTNFIQKYPNGGYSSNAEYWLGELYLVKKDYPRALEHFEVVLQKFPSSPKAAASMLKAGYAYAADGRIAEARTRLQEVLRTYPGTPTAQLAQAKLAILKSV